MANISFNDMDFSENNNFENSVGFFNLKEDGEEAIVRFVLDSVDDMEIYSVHTVKDEGKFKKFNCLRSPKEPTSKCPFCEKDAQVNKTDKSFRIISFLDCIYLSYRLLIGRITTYSPYRVCGI